MVSRAELRDELAVISRKLWVVGRGSGVGEGKGSEATKLFGSDSAIADKEAPKSNKKIFRQPLAAPIK